MLSVFRKIVCSVKAHAHFTIMMSIGLIVFCSLQKVVQQKTNWIAPEWADTLKFPFTNNSNTEQKGKILFEKLCTACHGNAGKGDGAAGVALKPRPQDLTSAMVQKQTKGAIFWKITTGRSPMASYKTVLTDDQRWQLVSYIRKLNP